ncbi:DUF4288 domain-containing protein [Planococcus shenhongbingii]|uniref:DUF4288 domain-containing protein n=1 Tax=Planococcus shenhongbingii TaxID=3058398 RepID=A0ABT8NCE2_9BACL|nr:DUF4288 domain-containing protein [Planococcus sp. N017]MDN7245551.1 DUF4288 domain-containing protein [Planococcus sp. N017]
MKKMTKDWDWYAVKVLYECLISGEAAPELMMDDNSPDDHKMFEESILLVKAPSIDQANAFGEKEARKQQHDYLNPYGEKVEWKFVELIHCVWLSAPKIQIGTEVYSRFLIVPPDIPTKEVISHYYPETVTEELVDKNLLQRNEDFDI